jgi:cell division protein FtsQ
MDKARMRAAASKAKSVSAPSEAPASSDTPTRPSRLLGAVRWALGGIFVVALATLVAFGGRHFATTSERFGFEKLAVSGATRFSEPELLRLLGVTRGANLFALDMDAAERRLVQHPWIASAELRRKLPATLELDLVEYRARAVAALGDQLYLVTREGHPIVRFDLNEHGEYPVVSGVSLDELAVDRVRGEERLARGIALLDAYERSALSATYAPEQLHMDTDGSVELVVGESGITLVFGKGPIEQKLLMATRVLGKVQSRGELPRVVFLDNEAHPERVVVRLR